MNNKRFFLKFTLLILFLSILPLGTVEDKKTITGGELRDLLFLRDVHAINLSIRDDRYVLPTTYDLQQFKPNLLPYRTHAYDCEDIADDARIQYIRKNLKNNAGQVFGTATFMFHEGNGHSVNIFYLKDLGNFYIIDYGMLGNPLRNMKTFEAYSKSMNTKDIRIVF